MVARLLLLFVSVGKHEKLAAEIAWLPNFACAAKFGAGGFALLMKQSQRRHIP